MNTKIINLYGGPGCGKSTLACELFVKLKKAGHSVELVREYVKDWAWQNRKIETYDQIYISGKQVHKETMLYGKVEYLITDSPLILAPFYQEYYQNESFMKQPILEIMRMSRQNGNSYFNFTLKRNKPYVDKGRYETEEQAIEIDKAIKDYLFNNDIRNEYLDLNDDDKADYIIGKIC